MSDPVNLSDLREMTDGDTEMEKILFEEFFSSADICLKELSANCLDGENESWRTNAHALKGIAINLGAAQLGELCKQAQENHGFSATQKQEILTEIQTEYQKVEAFLKNVLAASS
jgi:HPt (histidine-containing phosphotransfer) domain-containing protein